MNPWASFSKLLDSPDKLVAEILSINDSVATLKMITAGDAQVTLPASPGYIAGDFVFVQNSNIIAKAPNIPASPIEQIVY